MQIKKIPILVKDDWGFRFSYSEKGILLFVFHRFNPNLFGIRYFEDDQSAINFSNEVSCGLVDLTPADPAFTKRSP